MTIEEKISEKKRMLIVEDDSSSLCALALMFNRMGYGVTTADSADAARKLAGQYHVLLTDGLKGECFNLYNEINAGIKIIYTGSSDTVREARQRAIEVYEKPFGIDKIKARLGSL